MKWRVYRREVALSTAHWQSEPEDGSHQPPWGFCDYQQHTENQWVCVPSSTNVGFTEQRNQWRTDWKWKLYEPEYRASDFFPHENKTSKIRFNVKKF